MGIDPGQSRKIKMRTVQCASICKSKRPHLEISTHNIPNTPSFSVISKHFKIGYPGFSQICRYNRRFWILQFEIWDLAEAMLHTCCFADVTVAKDNPQSCVLFIVVQCSSISHFHNVARATFLHHCLSLSHLHNAPRAIFLHNCMSVSFTWQNAQNLQDIFASFANSPIRFWMLMCNTLFYCQYMCLQVNIGALLHPSKWKSKKCKDGAASAAPRLPDKVHSWHFWPFFSARPNVCHLVASTPSPDTVTLPARR